MKQESESPVAAHQSVHPTLGILRKSQAVSYALAFFWLDGFAVPAHQRLTQTVGRLMSIRYSQLCGLRPYPASRRCVLKT